MPLNLDFTGQLGAATAELVEQVRVGVAEVRTRGGGAGAGTIWRRDGTIVTNHHVVPRDEAHVTLADGRSFAGAVVARDPRNDLAVVKVTATDLPAVTIGDARKLRVGELVLAVGHPFGLRGAATIGVVSSPHEPGEPRQSRELVRADVLLGPGNSGGPLTDARGRVVGINAMVTGGLALAVPSHVAERLLANRGSPAHGRLGLGIRDVQLSPAMTARVPRGSGHGALVVAVAEGSAAEHGGLMLGDVLFAVNGRPLGGGQGLLEALASHTGGVLRLGLLRGGVAREVLVPLEQQERQAA